MRVAIATLCRDAGGVHRRRAPRRRAARPRSRGRVEPSGTTPGSTGRRSTRSSSARPGTTRAAARSSSPGPSRSVTGCTTRRRRSLEQRQALSRATSPTPGLPVIETAFAAPAKPPPHTRPRGRGQAERLGWRPRHRPVRRRSRRRGARAGRGDPGAAAASAMVQPFQASVDERGETACVFFARRVQPRAAQARCAAARRGRSGARRLPGRRRGHVLPRPGRSGPRDPDEIELAMQRPRRRPRPLRH